MVAVYLGSPSSHVGSEYLTAADIGPGEHLALVRDWENRGSKGLALFLKGFRKPLLLDNNAITALGRDFKEANWDLWFRKEVALSTSGTEISVRGIPRYLPPAPSPKASLAAELAATLARATAPPHNRTDAIAILRGAADLLAARQ
jgi:hypothetical protein